MINLASRQKRKAGSALVTILFIVMVGLIVVAAALTWTVSSHGMTHRYSQYTRTVAAAEAATEKAVVAINDDYDKLGQVYVVNNLNKYRGLVPTVSEHGRWSDYTFTDHQDRVGKMQVDYIVGTNLVAISPKYKGLLGFPSTFQVTARAAERNSLLTAGTAVRQQVLTSLIPIYQFAMFYNLDYECSALPVMVVGGPVHCNGNIHLTPHGGLTFNNDVTCTKKILRSAKSGNTVGGNGPVTYKKAHDGGLSDLALPIGTNNSLAAVRQIIEVPPSTEDINSAMGQQRLYNKADLIVLVSNTTIRVSAGPTFTSYLTNTLATNELYWIKTNFVFYNGREKKYHRCTEIDVVKLRQFNTNNVWVRSMLTPTAGAGDIRTIFVMDYRTTTSTTNNAVRLIGGQTLLPKGMTVATPLPLYIRGHYNCPNPSHLGTTNTSATVPASVLADAVTLLSSAFVDTAGAGPLSSRVAVNTTVNCAMVAGIVQTSTSKGYSGGVENFPRFLEEWTNRTLTYNGSMVVMFESQYATTKWDNIGIYYNPPIRNWYFDMNFRDPLKLPPATPAAYALMRGQWSVAQVQPAVVTP